MTIRLRAPTSYFWAECGFAPPVRRWYFRGRFPPVATSGIEAGERRIGIRACSNMTRKPRRARSASPLLQTFLAKARASIISNVLTQSVSMFEQATPHADRSASRNNFANHGVVDHAEASPSRGDRCRPYRSRRNPSSWPSATLSICWEPRLIVALMAALLLPQGPGKASIYRWRTLRLSLEPAGEGPRP